MGKVSELGALDVFTLMTLTLLIEGNFAGLGLDFIILQILLKIWKKKKEEILKMVIVDID